MMSDVPKCAAASIKTLSLIQSVYTVGITETPAFSKSCKYVFCVFHKTSDAGLISLASLGQASSQAIHRSG